MPLASSYSYPLLGAFWTVFEIFIWVIWIWTLVYIFIDIFRSHDLSGGAKALWFLFVLIIPLFGVLVYLIARGGSMHERAVQQAQQQDDDSPQLYPANRGGRSPRRPISWPSWPTCATRASSRTRSSRARRPRSWPEPGGPSLQLQAGARWLAEVTGGSGTAWARTSSPVSDWPPAGRRPPGVAGIIPTISRPAAYATRISQGRGRLPVARSAISRQR